MVDQPVDDCTGTRKAVRQNPTVSCCCVTACVLSRTKCFCKLHLLFGVFSKGGVGKQSTNLRGKQSKPAGFVTSMYCI